MSLFTLIIYVCCIISVAHVVAELIWLGEILNKIRLVYKAVYSLPEKLQPIAKDLADEMVKVILGG